MELKKKERECQQEHAVTGLNRSTAAEVEPERRSHQVDWRAQGGVCGHVVVEGDQQKAEVRCMGACVTTRLILLALIRRSAVSAGVERKQVPDTRDGSRHSVME